MACKGSDVSSRILLSLIAAGALFGTALPAAYAATESSKTQEQQVPGFYRQQVGAFTVTALYDGYTQISPTLLKGLDANEIQSLIAGKFQAKGDNGVQTAVNGYLIEANNKHILVDTGAAQCFGPTLGNIVNNLRAAGYQPAQVDTVLLTHMHPDHMCGLTTEDGKAVFPNAQVWAAKNESDFWLDNKKSDTYPEGLQSTMKIAQRVAAPYIAKNALHTFNDESEILPGIIAMASPGHTPGHTSYRLHSGDDTLLIWGDIVHSHAVQFPHPEVSVEFDVDGAKAVSSRKALMEQAAEKSWMVAGAHLPFPGIGHVKKEPQGYNWVPVEYAPLGKIN